MELPGPPSEEWIARREAAIPLSVFSTVQIFADHGHGERLTDVGGNEFIGM